MSDENEPSPETGRPAAYEIRVRGHLGSAWSDWFTGLRVTLEDHGGTLLAGPLDQAALHGVLRRVRDLGLQLISVTRIESEPTRAAGIAREPGSSQRSPRRGRGLLGPPQR